MTQLNARLRQLFLACALIVTGATSAAPITEIVPLHHGLAETLVPAVQPMLSPTERVSAYGTQLIIRAEPERIAEIRTLIHELDKKPSRLRISVANSGGTTDAANGYRVDGRIGDRSGEVVIGDPRSGNRARIIHRETRRDNDGVRQLTASEGYPVFIQSGQSVPITTRSQDEYGRVIDHTQYQDVTQGFYATVRVNGEIATIRLSSNNDQISPDDDQRIDVRHISTQVSARLGEWVTIGSVSDIATGSNRDLGRRTTTRRQDSGTIRLMVERLD